MIGNELVVQHYLYAAGMGDLKPIGDPLYNAKMCMAVKKGNLALLGMLNKGIAHAQEEGTLYKIQAKWLGAEYAKPALPLHTMVPMALGAAALLALIILLALLWKRKLRDAVEARTRLYADSEERLRLLFENSPDAIHMIDVRDADEYAQGSFPGSSNIPVDELESKIAGLPSDKPIVFVCATGARSGEAFDMVKMERDTLKVYFLDAEITHTKGQPSEIKAPS